MKDFLSQLVARSTAPALAVRPRLPSRFEAASETAGITAFPSESTPSAPSEPTASPARTSRTSPHNGNRQPAPPTPAEPEASIASPSPQTAPPPLQNHALSRSSASATIQPASAEVHSSKQEAPSSPSPSPAHKTPIANARPNSATTPPPKTPLFQPSLDSDIQPPKSPRPDSVSEGASQTAAVSVAKPQPVSPTPLASATPPAAASSLRSQSQISNLKSQIPRPIARPAIATRPTPSMPQTAPATPAPPVVQITIGRVELRAIVTPASPRALPPPAPKLGLDEYLRQRTGGAR